MFSKARLWEHKCQWKKHQFFLFGCCYFLFRIDFTFRLSLGSFFLPPIGVLIDLFVPWKSANCLPPQTDACSEQLGCHQYEFARSQNLVDRLTRIVVISSGFSVNITEHSGAIVNFEVKRGGIPKSQHLFFTSERYSPDAEDGTRLENPIDCRTFPIFQY